MSCDECCLANKCLCLKLYVSSHAVLPWRGLWELWGEGKRHSAANISTALLGHHQSHRLCFICTYLQSKTWCEQTGGCGGLCLCNKSSSSMWFECPLPFPSQKRVTQDTRAKEKKKHMQLHDWTPPLASSPNPIIKTPSPGCEGLSHRQPVSGGSPFAFVHSFFFSFTSFSAEPLLPWGWVRPVPVLLRLDTSEATKKKSLEVDVNNFPQPELYASSEQSNLLYVLNIV